jgi:hypothetical protein
MRTGVSRRCRAVSGRAPAFVVAPDTAVALALIAVSQTIALLSIAVPSFSRVDIEGRPLSPVLPPCRSFPRPSHYREYRYNVVADFFLLLRSHSE